MAKRKRAKSKKAKSKLDVGAKVLGGLTALSLVMALLSDGDPDNDAWVEGDAAAAGTTADNDAGGDDGSDGVEVDAWSAGASTDGADDDDAAPSCTGTAPFAGEGGTVLTPVAGPVRPFASPACRLATGRGSSEAVRLLQGALAMCNGQPVTVDGGYGAETRRAVSALQSQLGVGVDGEYGAETRAAMAWPVVSDDSDTPCARVDAEA
jgi:hypothetical protein